MLHDAGGVSPCGHVNNVLYLHLLSDILIFTKERLAQALLEGISLSQPQPKIPSELIKFLGKTFNCWHIALPLLETHIMLFPTVRTP